MKTHHLHDTQGERKDQLLIIADKEGKPIGSATREECHSGKGRTHLAFMAFIIHDSKIILAKRASKKSLWAGYWDASVVSHVLPGEIAENAAKRRGKEEMGVEVDFKDIGAFYYFAKHGAAAENEYCHVLIGKSSEEIHPNPIEIDGLKKIILSKLKRDIIANEKKYTPWLRLAIEKVDLSVID